MDRLSKLAAFQDPSDEPEDGGQKPPNGEGAPRPTTAGLSLGEEGGRLEAAMGAPSGAKESSPGREPWVRRPSPRPSVDGLPSPARAGERMWVRAASSTHGSRRGPHSAAPNGAVRAFPQVRGRRCLSCSTGTNLGSVRETPGFAQKTKNRGNEAKKSLKTKEVTKTMCAKRTRFCAQKAANEAKKAAFRCKRRTSTGGVRLSRAKSPPAALRIAGFGRARACQKTASLCYPRPRQATPHPPAGRSGLRAQSAHDPSVGVGPSRFGWRKRGRGPPSPQGEGNVAWFFCPLPTAYCPPATALKRFHYPTVSGRLCACSFLTNCNPQRRSCLL